MRRPYIMSPMKYVTPINPQQQDQVAEQTRHFLQFAESLFGSPFPEIPVHFDLKGRSSGMYTVRGRGRSRVCDIRYNPWIFARHFDECMAITVPHEVAHYVVDKLYGMKNVKPHGVEWKAVMNAFGADPRVTANMSLDGIPRRTSTVVNYRCGCGDQPMGIRRHHKVVRGEAYYSCRRCGDVLIHSP